MNAPLVNLPRRNKPADHSVDRRMLGLIVMSLLVGSGGAMGAWLLLKMIALATNLFWFGHFSTDTRAITEAHQGINVLLTPVLGSLIIGVMARFGSEKIKGHGIPEAIEAILYGESRMSPKVALLKPLSAAISIGSGGPFGAEGPIIMTGGAIGSLFAQSFHLSAAERKTLLVAGAAAGMTAIFNTPLAAVLLAIEVLLFEWKPRSFVPVVTAVMVSWCWRNVLFTPGPLFPFHSVASLSGSLVPGAVVLGIITGVLAIVLSNGLYRIEDLFHRLPLHWMWWPALGSIVVGAGGLINPHVLGTGYDNIQNLLDGSLAMQAIMLLLLVKGVVWLVSLGSGTSGGVVAPLLILGGALGALAGHFLPGGVGLCAMLGMAGILSGAMRAPLTGALFAAEVTGHVALLPLLLAASVTAYAMSVMLMPRSIFTERLARRGRHVLQEYHVDPLETTPASSVMTQDVKTLSGDLSASAAVAFFLREHRHHSYPLVDNQHQLLGVVSREAALEWQNRADYHTLTLADLLLNQAQTVAASDTLCAALADHLFDSQHNMLPIVDSHGQLSGVVTRFDLLKVRGTWRRHEASRQRFIGARR